MISDMAAHRVSRVFTAVLLCFGLAGAATLVGCSSEGASTSCDSTSSCTVTFDRKSDTAKVTILGVTVQLVSADDESVTLSVGGTEVTVKNNATTSVGELTIGLDRITADQVTVKITRA
jgi:hypothetical protein